MKHILFASLLISLSAFGSNGSSGRDGYDGRNGYPGRNISVVADGTSQRVNNYGTDGTDGSHGGNGGNAYCSGEESGNGGDGGRGGSGGDAGDGGEIVAYFADIANLARVQVFGEPGSPGRGGYGGSGGSGCGPSGRNGSNGGYGSNGRTGYYGRVILIGQLNPLLPTNPQYSFAMDTMENSSFLLSNNNWETRTGARSLFGSGSRMANSYYYWMGRTEVNYQLEWKARKPLTDFKGKKMLLTLENGTVSKSLPSNIWYTGVENNVGGNTVYTFETAYYDSELFNFGITSAAGAGTGLTVQITDKNAISDLVGTDIHIDYLVKANAFYYNRYCAKVPPEAVTITADKIDVAVGTLPIDPKYLTAGTYSLIKLSVKRSLGGHAGTKVVSTYHQLK